MALPTSRNTTYVAGVSQVKAADLNDLQDKIIDLNTELRASQVAIIPGSAFHPIDETKSYTRTQDGYVAVGAHQQMLAHMPPGLIPVGAIIDSAAIRIKTSGTSGSREAQLSHSALDATSPTLVGNVTSSTTSSQLNLALVTGSGSGIPHTVLANKLYMWLLDLWTSDWLNSVAITFHIPHP